MGYDRTRFLSKVDDEFICTICTSVIENPVETPCEHLFCNKCINDWLVVNKTCPIDGRPLTTDDLSDPSRVLRNLLNKLDIKCDFEQEGCQTITKLVHLGQHVSKCVHNVDAQIVCDKGCNMTTTRREYLEHSCVSHLAKEFTKLRHQLSEQKSHFERTLDSQTKENRKLSDELSDQKRNFERNLDSQAKENRKLSDELGEQKCHFERTLDSQAKENSKLSDELREQKCHFERTLDSQAEEIRKLRDELDRENKEQLENSNSNLQKEEIAELCADISLNEQQKWQQMYNVKIGPENVLENEKEGFAFVQSANALQPTKSSFEIHVIESTWCIENLYIGLTRRGHFRGLDLQNIEDAFFNYSDSNCFFTIRACTNGDVIECGIEFPKDFIDDGKHSAQLYVSLNQKLKFKGARVIPKDGLFPTILFKSFSKVKVRYFQK